MRTADQIEEQKAQKAQNSGQTPKLKRTLPPQLESFKFKPGVSGNPGGRPKKDLAAEIAQMAFEAAPEQIAKAMLKQLLKGNAYTFKELAERAFGKLKERVELEGSETLIALLQKRRNKLAGK